MVEKEEPAGDRRIRLLWPRLLLGLIVLISAEVFSGASLQSGLWDPWTLIVTYWLYFAHFFFFTTLAIGTGRTSFWSLYLWGILFGLYESWITKVIWFGYGGDGEFALGSIGLYGYSEMSMVFLFHPMMSLILPLGVACVLCPPLRGWFPDLAWITGPSRGARLLRVYLVASFGPIVAMNSGGIANLALNLLFAGALAIVLLRLSRPYLSTSDGRSFVTLGPAAFCATCVYLLLLYGTAYFHLRPEGLPSGWIQLATLVFYGLAILGLCLHGRQTPSPDTPVSVEPREWKSILTTVTLVLGLGIVLAPFRGTHVLSIPIQGNLMIWTPLGVVLAAFAMVRGRNAGSRA
ncbi:MAG: hypothetical protein KBE65_08260 [Phycisphaerae bacterium]|nr:hypothetical protein [Phycisphaerae bacterium]